MTISGDSIEQSFGLVFEPDMPSDITNREFVAVPMANLIGKTSVTLFDLVAASLKTISSEFSEERQRTAAALDLMESNPPTNLLAFGPVDGDYYIELTKSEQK